MGFEARFIAEFKDRLISCYKQNWHSEIESENKYRWFYSFKCIFEPEKYLLLITNKWLRDMLAKFRSRVRGLKNHKQWVVIREEGDLTCPMCGQASEDEGHFLSQCQAYVNSRMKYNIFESATTQFSMKHVSTLLAFKDETEIKTLAKYITEAMSVRKKKTEQN